MRLPFVVFLSGVIVGSTGAALHNPSLQWRYRRQGALASNSTSSPQSLPDTPASGESDQNIKPDVPDPPQPLIQPDLNNSPPLDNGFDRPAGVAQPSGGAMVVDQSPPEQVDNVDDPSLSPSASPSSSWPAGVAKPSDAVVLVDPGQQQPANVVEDTAPSAPPEVLSDPQVVPAASNATISSPAKEQGVPLSDPEPQIKPEPSGSAWIMPFPTAGVNDGTASSDPGVWNSTTPSPTSDEDSMVTPPPFPLIKNSTDASNDTEIVKEDVKTCGGCVVNAQAGVEWWYPANVYQDIASVSTIQLNGTQSYTMVPLSTWTSLSEQLSQATFMYTETFDEVLGTMVGDYIFTELPPPLAASTSVTTIYDVKSPAPTSTFGVEELNELYIAPDTPFLTVPNAVPAPVSATQVDNIAYYTAYEVEFDESTTDEAGNVQCQKSTSTITLDQPYGYTVDPFQTFGDSLTATGALDKGFLDYIPYATCTPGIWTATAPVMVVVVEITYQRGFSIFLVHHEVSDPGTLQVPTATGDGDEIKQNIAATEVNTVPAVVTVNNSPVTLQVAVTGNPASVTVPIGGNTVVASVIGGGTGQQNNNNNPGGNGDGVASAIINAIGGGNQGTTAVNGIGFGNTGNTGTGGTGAGAANGGNNAAGNAAGNSGGNAAGNGAGNGAAAGGNGGIVGGNGGSGGVPVITVGGNTFVGNQATEFFIAPGQILTPGGVATLGGSTISLAQGANSIVVNGVTSQLAVPAITPAPSVINFQGQQVTANAGGAFVIQGQTLAPGGQIVVGSNTVSLGSNGNSLVVNGLTVTPPAALPTGGPVITIDGTTFQAQNGAQSFIIGGQTLQVGGTVTANGNTIALLNPSVAVVNGQTLGLGQILTPIAVNVAGTQFNALPGGSFIIQGTTLRPGSQAVIAGTTLSFGQNGQFIVVNGQTSTLAIGTIPALVIDGTIFAATSGIAGGYVIGGQTLLPGQVITANGHTISLAANGLALVVDGSTSFLNVPVTTLPPLLTIGGKTYTANSGTTYLINGQILTPGGFIVADGTTISLSPYATALVVNGRTTKLFPATNVPVANSAVATSTPAFRTPSGPSNSAASATSTKKSSAHRTLSSSHSATLALAATLLSFFGAFIAWM